jgi:hypothetical protein
MSEDKANLNVFSRRAVIAIAPAAPTIGAMVVEPCTPHVDYLVSRCAEWLALDLEIDRLSLRWSELETAAAREFNWFRLSQTQRRAVPMAAEMDKIERQLDALLRARERGLKTLDRLPARDVHGIASKLMVAAKISQLEDGAAHSFVADAVRALAILKCPKCGAPYTPAATCSYRRRT